RLPVAEGLAWVDQETAANVARSAEPLETAKLWGTMKLESNGVRTVIMHALMHTRGLIARPWRQGLTLGACETDDGLAVVMRADSDWSGKLAFDKPRHQVVMGFARDWPRMNTMPEWFTVEADQQYVVKNTVDASEKTYSGKQLQEGLPIELTAGKEVVLRVCR
ncbi:MAG TPA: hypothetical protein VE890_03150, partial [Thermoguttaceae bacterium]|nr:hypothetical protein [Thermoguttaceae bacterium]